MAAPRRAFSSPTDYNAFAAKLNSSGVVQWNTFLGGSGGRDGAYGLALDGSGNIYIAGDSVESWGTPLQAFHGDHDGYVARLTNSGDLVWNTFLGSASGITMWMSIAVSSAGNLYICGYSTAAWGSPWLPFSGIYDVAVAKMSGSGALVWNAFMGSQYVSMGYDIVLDPAQNICFTGPWNLTWASLGSGLVAKISGDPLATTASFNTGLGTVNLNTDAGSVSNAAWLAPADMRCSAPSGFIFPYGMFSFNIGNLTAGQTARVTLKFPNPLPLGTTYYKCINGSLVDCTSLVTRVDEYTLIITLTDGGLGDADGVANGTIVDPGGLAFPLGTPQSSSAQMPVTAPQKPVSLSNISVKSASLSATKVAPGEKVTVTASVANTGTGNGTSTIKLLVNGAEDSKQGVSVNSGGSSTVTFDVSRIEPGTYTVYVGGISAGSFTVDEFTPNTILFISGALVFFALVGGMIWITRRRM